MAQPKINQGKKGTRIPKRLYETSNEAITRMEQQDKRADEVGLPRMLVGEHNDKDIAEAAAKKYMQPPTQTDINTHMARINAGRDGVADNGGKKKKAK